jgi:hypothetical protein
VHAGARPPRRKSLASPRRRADSDGASPSVAAPGARDGDGPGRDRERNCHRGVPVARARTHRESIGGSGRRGSDTHPAPGHIADLGDDRRSGRAAGRLGHERPALAPERRRHSAAGRLDRPRYRVARRARRAGRHFRSGRDHCARGHAPRRRPGLRSRARASQRHPRGDLGGRLPRGSRRRRSPDCGGRRRPDLLGNGCLLRSGRDPARDRPDSRSGAPCRRSPRGRIPGRDARGPGLPLARPGATQRRRARGAPDRPLAACRRRDPARLLPGARRVRR